MRIRTIIIFTAIIIIANTALVGYIYGYRLADFSELPNSQRPGGVYTQATVDTVIADIYNQ
jgi:hypothetical protein